MSGTYCIYCFKTDAQLHRRGEEHHKSENNKMVIKHDCQVECWKNREGISFDSCSKNFQLNQAYVDFLEKWEENNSVRFLTASCPKCRMEQLKPQVKNLDIFKPEMQEKIKREFEDLKKVIGDKDNPNDRERERERESILTYFQQHNIKSITLQNDKLVIEYNNNSPTETKLIDTSELQLIKSYCQAKGLTSLSLTDLQKSQTQQPTNHLPLIIGGGIILVLIIGIIAYFSMRKKKRFN